MYNEIEHYLNEMKEHLSDIEYEALKTKTKLFLERAKELRKTINNELNNFAKEIQATFRNAYTRRVIDPICVKAGILYPLQALLNEGVFNLLTNGTTDKGYISEKLHKLIRELEDYKLISNYVITETSIYRHLKNED